MQQEYDGLDSSRLRLYGLHLVQASFQNRVPLVPWLGDEGTCLCQTPAGKKNCNTSRQVEGQAWHFPFRSQIATDSQAIPNASAADGAHSEMERHGLQIVDVEYTVE